MFSGIPVHGRGLRSPGRPREGRTPLPEPQGGEGALPAGEGATCCGHHPGAG